MRVASIDLGTNTFRILIGERSDRGLCRLYVNRAVTRLGGGFDRNGRLIAPQAIERALKALDGFSAVLKRYGVGSVRAVGTSILRESENGSLFIEQVKNKTGIEIEVISGLEEARLTVCGVLKSVSYSTKGCIVFDIGGGSTEYAFVKESEIKWVHSTSLGVVNLAETYLKSQLLTHGEVAEISDEIERVLKSDLPIAQEFSLHDLTLVGTAGTLTTLASIALGLSRYDEDLVNGFILSHERVASMFDELSSLTLEERSRVKGLEKGREDLIVPGMLIVLKTMDKFSKDSVLVSEGGLLEGVAYSIVV